jgi:hypothetical protein
MGNTAFFRHKLGVGTCAANHLAALAWTYLEIVNK